MGLRNSFSLYGTATTSWARILQHGISNTDRVTLWKDDAILSLEVLIIVGISLILIAFFGCGFSILYFENANFRKWRIIFCMTVMFAALFLIAMIAQSAGAINMLIKVPTAKDDFTEAFKNYFRRTEDKQFVDSVQNRLLCCGIYSYRDYEEILHSPTIPGSCCLSWKTCTVDDVIYKHGCAPLLNIYGYTLAYNIYAISIFTLINIVAEFTCFIIALYFANSIRKRNNANNQAKNYQDVTFGNNSNKIFGARS